MSDNTVDGLKDAPRTGATNLAGEVKMVVAVELGRVRVPLRDILSWTEGSLIELDKIAGEPVDVRVSNKVIAQGEVVVVAENYGVRLTKLVVR
jgi:flagellar motor switch protein FliN/FliY